MDKINWANYSYDEFELFCNALLTFEIGKSYQPFSAPGQDGGIDGAYFGNYENQTGKWRFQFKYRQSARSQAFSDLKIQMKKEAEKLADEDFFVLLTNVELLPQENLSLIEIFQNELQNLGKICNCMVWDGAKIYNLFIQYPLLSLWLNEGFKTAQVQDYQNVFNKNLSAKEFAPGSFSNVFISRENDMDKLSSFLDSEQAIALVTGEAGIGKTRLVVEFFKQKVGLLEDWMPLVLMNRHVDFDKIRKSLTSKLNFIILIDDAHTYKAEVIADMKALAESVNGKVKIILTARTLEAFNSLTLIKEYEAENFPQIKLDELSRSDTEQLFRHYITNTSYLHYINELVVLSYGKPIMVVAILNAISENTPISKIKEQGFLKNYVKNYFGSFIEKISGSTGISKSSIQSLLQNIALIEPFNFNDSSTINKLSEIHDIKSQYVNEALKLLLDKGFVNGRYEQSIKPDYYSDILLSEIDNNEVVNYITEFAVYIDNIIINLSSVDEVNAQNRNILNEILVIYTGSIENGKNIDAIKKVLSTVLSISFIQPEIAKAAIRHFVEGIAQNDHLLTLDYQENLKFNYQSGDEPINKVISILTNLYANAANLDFVVKNAVRLYSITEDKKLVNIFSFSKKDVIERFTMTRQIYLLTEFSKRLPRYPAKELKFILSCIASLLNLDFTLSEWNAVNRDSINITTYYLPASSNIKKLRKTIIDILFQLYLLPNAQELRKEVIKHILDVPRGIFATSRNSTIYKNDIEIKRVLEFFKKNAPDFSIVEQKEVLEKLYWFKKWGMPDSMLPLADEVKEALKPKNLTEKISQLFSKAEVSILEMPNVDQYVSGKVDEFVSLANAEELSDSIIEFLEPQQYPPHYYWNFQDTLENNYPEYAKVLNDKMFEKSFTLYNLYGYRILGTMYFKHNDNEFYWDQVKKLQQLKSIDADNVLLAVYGQRVPGKTILTDRDIDVILKVYIKKRKENNYLLSSALQSLFVVNHPETLTYCKDFLARAHQREAEIFFIRLSDNETVTDEQMADLILNDTIPFDLTYAIERCLNKVLIIEGIDAIFSYLVKRYQLKKQIVTTSKSFGGYQFVPDGEHTHLFDQCAPEVRIQMFFKAIYWYLLEDDEGGHLYYAKDLLEYLQPGRSLSNELTGFYQSRIQDLCENGEQLDRLIESLSIFHIKDDDLLALIVQAYDIVHEFKDVDEEMYKKLRTQCYLAITTMGVKSGTANLPFQVDIDLRDLILTYINRLPEHYPACQFLKEVLKSVNAEIDRTTDRENSTW